MLELRQLKELLTLAQSKTVSQAAQELCLSQPALSRSLQRLEAELQVELFHHGKNKIELTATGELALSYARQILDSSAVMVQALRQHYASQFTVRLQTCAPAPLWELTALCSLAFPELTQTVSIKEEESELLSALEQGQVDCVVVTQPPAKTDLICLPFLTEQLYFALHYSHPLAQQSKLNFAQLDGSTFLLRPHIGFWQKVVDQYLPHCAFLRQQDDQAFNTILNDSRLLSFTSDIVLKREGTRRDRIAIPIADAAATVTYYALIPRNTQDKLTRLIAQLELKAQRLKLAQSSTHQDLLT